VPLQTDRALERGTLTVDKEGPLFFWNCTF